MSATISEPFLLSTYSLSKSLPNDVTGVLNRNCAYVSSTTHQCAPAKGKGNGLNADGYATVTAQGDGVHVLDVSFYIHRVVLLGGS